MDDLRSNQPTQHFSVAIVGTGFGGLCMAIKLKEAGIHDFVLFEKSDAVGGTWRDNEYPGCACDVPSHMYSYSFEPNARWSRTYASQPEIRAYIDRCAAKHNLLAHVRFNAEIVGARWDASRARWTVRTASGEAVTADAVVTAMGGLSRPSIPKLEGLSRFSGPSFHSAAWDKSVDLRGKRVAVIGTGASAIQFVPEIAGQVGKLHLFQRTAPWVLPRLERAYTELEKRIYEHVPGARFLHRQRLYWAAELRSIPMHVEPRIMALAERFAVKHIERSIKDPVLVDKLTPRFRMGCKRVLMSNTYYPALARENVEVVTDGIREVTEKGIVTQDGELREVDVIIFGTGFDVHDYVGPINVTGKDGVDLRTLWSKGAEGYLGTTVAGFPNLFTLVGPNTGLGHNSIIFMIEAQVEYVMRAIDYMRRENVAAIDVKPEVQRRYNAKIQARLGRTVWQTGGCQSWYRNADGKNTTLWPTFTFTFRQALSRFVPSDYARVAPKVDAPRAVDARASA